MASKAFYYQSGLSNDINACKKYTIDRNIDKEWQILASNVVMMVKMVQEKKIYFTWSFN